MAGCRGLLLLRLRLLHVLNMMLLYSQALITRTHVPVVMALVDLPRLSCTFVLIIKVILRLEGEGRPQLCADLHICNDLTPDPPSCVGNIDIMLIC